MPATEPHLSVIICTRNGAATIGDQLRSLAAQTIDRPWEVLVVDNGSTDDTLSVVASVDLRVPVRVVDASERAGLAYARNVGVRHAAAPAVAFCDDDDEVGPTWAAAMVDALDAHELVAARLVYDHLNDATVAAGRSTFQTERVETLFGIPVCAGACGVQKQLWEAAGGNDETLTDTGEDFDFAMRVHRLHGVTPHFAPDAVYHHRLRGDTAGTWRQAAAFGRSHAMLWARHGAGRTTGSGELRHAAKEWWWVLTRAPFAAAGRNRSAWARRGGRRFGRLHGSFRHRVLVP